MTSEEIIEQFGLPSSAHHRSQLRGLLTDEIERASRGEDGEDVLKTLCAQLFSIGIVDDALLIWEAKESSFDAHCGIDIQFVCGAGLNATKEHLSMSKSRSASAALKYLTECEQAGDFTNWTPEITLTEYRRYFGIQ